MYRRVSVVPLLLVCAWAGAAWPQNVPPPLPSSPAEPASPSSGNTPPGAAVLAAPSPPASRTAAARAGELLLMILPGGTGVPGSTSSSPVERIATLTLLWTFSESIPDAASILISAGRITDPDETIHSPALISSPLNRICCPAFTAAGSVTLSPCSPETSSNGTTASNPGGIGAPVRVDLPRPLD